MEPDSANGQAGLGVSFSRTRERLSFTGGAVGGARRDTATVRPWSADYQGRFALGLSMSRRTRAEVRQLATYASINPLAPITAAAAPDVVFVPAGNSQAFSLQQALTSVTDTTVTHNVSRRTAFVITHGYNETRGGRAFSARAQSAGAAIERRLSSSTSARVGYRWTEATSADRFLKTHDVEAAVEYQGLLPFARRATIAGGGGSSIIDDGDRQIVRVLADASVSYPLWRSWLAYVTFSRPVQMMQGMTAPLVLTTVAATLTGEIGRQHRIVLTADAFRGNMSLDDPSSTRAEGYSASLAWRHSLTRRLSFNTEVFHGRFRSGPQVTLAGGVPRDGVHVGARAFVSIMAPVIRSGRGARGDR
jgi:hypothetical protein